MIDINDKCSVASDNLRLGIDAERRFPCNVFVGDWSNFLFFDSDWMFDAEFVTRVQAFLETEGGSCACVQNLDAQSSPVFTITIKTTPDEYRDRLVGADAEHGWIYDMGRFGCASDSGDWCMYCERSAEIAVIALRRFGAAEKYRPLWEEFRAAPLADAIRDPLSYGFSPQALAATWRNELMREYAARSRE